MEKVRGPRFVDHVGRGEKPKFKSFLLHMHRAAAAAQETKDEGLQRETLEEATLDLLPKRVLPHPKKRMQMYKEVDASDDTSNEGDHSIASPTSLEPNVPTEYPRCNQQEHPELPPHQTTSEQPYLLSGSHQPHDSDKLRISNDSNLFLKNKFNSQSDVFADNSANFRPVNSKALSTNVMQNFEKRKEYNDLTMLKHSRFPQKPIQDEQSVSNNFNLTEFKRHLISESDQSNFSKSEIFRFDGNTSKHDRRNRSICSNSLMEYETYNYPPNVETRDCAPNSSFHVSPRKGKHNVFSKQRFNAFAANDQLMKLTSSPNDLQCHTIQPQFNRTTNREILPRVPPLNRTEKKMLSEYPISENNPWSERLLGTSDYHSSWHQSVPQSLVHQLRLDERPEDLSVPRRGHLLAELISAAVNSGRQRELPQLVPSRPARTKQFVADDGAAKDQPGQNRKRQPNGDVEQWHHERRREHSGYRGAGEAYPPPFHPTPTYSSTTVPYPRSSPGGGAPYPPTSSQHGYSPPGSYHPYHREDPTVPLQAPASLSARDKTISWLSGAEPQCLSPTRVVGSSSYADSKTAARKGDNYKNRHMSEWESRDVAHFLIEASDDLGICYENTHVSQLNQVDGRKLLSMEPKHFEKFSPTEGQRVYDYVRRHRNHEMLTKEGQNENYRSDGQQRSIETPPPLSVDTSNSSIFPNDVYAEYSSIQQQSPTLSGSLPYDLQSGPLSTQSFPGNPSIQLGSMGPPIPQEANPVNPYQGAGMMPGHSSAGYPPITGDMFASTSDQYQYPINSVASGSHVRSNAPHLQVDSYPTALNKSFYPLHDSSAIYPSHEPDERDPNGGMRREDCHYPHHSEMRPPSSMFTDISEQEESSDDDDEDEEEEEEAEKPPEPPKKRGPGRPPKPESERKKKKRTGRLWEFIRNLLLNPETCPSIVKWEDAEAGVFRFVQSEKVAERWGMRKNNQKMNYEKLSRAMRYYYKGKVFEPVLGRRLVYKFGANAKGWKPNNANFGQ